MKKEKKKESTRNRMLEKREKEWKRKVFIKRKEKAM